MPDSVPKLSTSKQSTEDSPYWQTHLANCKRSGLSRRAYCRQHQLDYHRFQYQCHKLRVPSPTATPCVPVKIKAHPRRSALVGTLELSSGHRFLIYDSQVLFTLFERIQ